MLRKAVCAAVVLAFSVGLAVAGQIDGAIKKIDMEGGKITIATKFDKETKKFTEEKTLSLARSVKVVKAKRNKEDKKVEAGEALEDGLKNERFKNIGERGIRAQIITDDNGLVTEIRVFSPRKKKN